MENTKSPQHVTRKEMLKMNSTASGVKGILETYRIRLNILEESIKADLKSKMEFDRTLEALENRKKDLEFRIKANKHWVDEYDVKVGPQQQQYEDMKKQIAIIYDHAKEGHQKGIGVLKQEFGYHPLFKHPGDTFTATAFRPK